MNKTQLMRLITAFLLVGVVLNTLTACSPMSLLEKFKPKETVQLDGQVVCYASPDVNSDILATFNNGLSVSCEQVLSIGGIQWAECEHGWVILDQQDQAYEQTVETTAATLPPISVEAFVKAKLLNVRSGPGEDYEQLTQIPTGTKVVLNRISEDERWGRFEQGWVYIGHLYFPGDSGENTGYAVVKEKKVTVYDAVRDGKKSLKTLKTGTRVKILELLTVDGQRWGYAEDGWVPMEFLYLEGDEGKRPCYGIVVDSTPLNVRKGPSTKFDIITSLPYGTPVEVIERIKCNGNDWGYIGTGWIYMKNVDIQ